MSAESPAMPTSAVIERAVIASMVLDAGALDTCRSLLTAEEFYAPQRGELFTLIASLPRVDLTIVREALHGFNDVQREITLRDELDACMRQLEWVGEGFSTADYCEELRDRRVCRDIIRLGGKLCVDGSKGIPVGREFIEYAEAEFSKVLASRQGKKQAARDLFEELDDLDADLTKPPEERTTNALASTGLPGLDAMTGGIQRGDFYIFLGRPGDGKSALSMQLAREVAVEHRVLVFNYEMKPQKLTIRTVSSLTGIDSQLISRGELTARQHSEVRTTIAALRALKMRFMPWRDKTLDEIKSSARAEFRKNGPIGAIVVDYLQLMNASKGSYRLSRDQQLAEVTRGLKALTHEFDCAVFGVSSQNRDMKTRQNKRPTMSDARECGSIEYDANNIIGVYRPDSDPTVECEESEKGTAELIVMKQREGGTGIVRCRFDAKTTTFLQESSARHLRIV